MSLQVALPMLGALLTGCVWELVVGDLWYRMVSSAGKKVFVRQAMVRSRLRDLLMQSRLVACPVGLTPHVFLSVNKDLFLAASQCVRHLPLGGRAFTQRDMFWWLDCMARCPVSICNVAAVMRDYAVGVDVASMERLLCTLRYCLYLKGDRGLKPSLQLIGIGLGLASD